MKILLLSLVLLIFPVGMFANDVYQPYRFSPSGRLLDTLAVFVVFQEHLKDLPEGMLSGMVFYYATDCVEFLPYFDSWQRRIRGRVDNIPCYSAVTYLAEWTEDLYKGYGGFDPVPPLDIVKIFLGELSW